MTGNSGICLPAIFIKVSRTSSVAFKRMGFLKQMSFNAVFGS
jgi:hypothetical protein